MSITSLQSTDSPGSTPPAPPTVLPEAPAPMQRVHRVARTALIRRGAYYGDLHSASTSLPRTVTRMSKADAQDKLIRTFVKNALLQSQKGEFLLKILNQERHFLTTHSPDDSPFAELLATLVINDAECFAKALEILQTEKYNPEFLCPYKNGWRRTKHPICSFLEKWVQVFLKLDPLGQKNGLHFLAWYLQNAPLDPINNTDLASFFNELLKNMNPVQFQTAELSTLINFALCIFRSNLERNPLTANEIRLITHLLARPGAYLEENICQKVIPLEDHGLLWHSLSPFKFLIHFPNDDNSRCFENLFMLSRFHPHHRINEEEKIAMYSLLGNTATQLLFFALAAAYYTDQEFLKSVNVFVNSLTDPYGCALSPDINNAIRFKNWVIHNQLKEILSYREWHHCYALTNHILRSAHFKKVAPLCSADRGELLEFIGKCMNWHLNIPNGNCNQFFGSIQELTLTFEALHMQFPQTSPSYQTLVPEQTLYPAVLLYLGREAQRRLNSSFANISVKKIITSFVTTAERATLLESLGYLLRHGFRLSSSTAGDIYTLIHDKNGNLYPFTLAQIPQVVFALDILREKGFTLSLFIHTLYSQLSAFIARRQLGH